LSSGDKYIPARAAIFQSSGQIVLLSMIWASFLSQAGMWKSRKMEMEMEMKN